MRPRGDDEEELEVPGDPQSHAGQLVDLEGDAEPAAVMSLIGDSSDSLILAAKPLPGHGLG